MKRKAVSTLGVIASTVIGIMLILAVMVVFFTPTGLYSAVKKMLPDPTEHLPLGTASGTMEGSLEKRDAVSVFDEFVQAYVGLSKVEQEQCFLLLPQKQFKTLFEEHYIEIQRDGEDLYIVLDNQVGAIRKEHEGAVVSTATSIKVENAMPCVVSGSAASLFYNYWLDQDNAPGSKKAPLAVKDADKIGLMKGYDLIVDGQSSLSMDSDGKTFVLYKAGNSICIFPLASWKGEDCKVRSKDGIQALDNDCLDEKDKDSLQQLGIKRHYPIYYNGHCSEWPLEVKTP